MFAHGKGAPRWRLAPRVPAQAVYAALFEGKPMPRGPYRPRQLKPARTPDDGYRPSPGGWLD